MRAAPVTARLLIALLLGAATSCAPSKSADHLNVSLSANEVYKYPTVGGDEEGARIATQAHHYSTSEMQRDSTTDFIPIYVYRPALGYLGSDDVSIEVITNPIGTTEASRTRLVTIHFEVH
jgi:hypothetical protein